MQLSRQETPNSVLEGVYAEIKILTHNPKKGRIQIKIIMSIQWSVVPYGYIRRLAFLCVCWPWERMWSSRNNNWGGVGWGGVGWGGVGWGGVGWGGVGWGGWGGVGWGGVGWGGVGWGGVGWGGVGWGGVGWGGVGWGGVGWGGVGWGGVGWGASLKLLRDLEYKKLSKIAGTQQIDRQWLGLKKTIQSF